MPRPKPSEVTKIPWINETGPPEFESGQILGKWLVFSPISQVDETWEQIREAVASGALGAVAAKVATAYNNPYASDVNTKVICVYTTKETVDEVGIRLIHLPRVFSAPTSSTIRYKTDQATAEGKYTKFGCKKTTCRSIRWNNGDPIFGD